MFITIATTEGESVELNTDFVVTATKLTRPTRVTESTIYAFAMSNGEEVRGTVSAPHWFDFDDIGTIVPAAPGYELVTVYESDDPDGYAVVRDPVLAWRTNRYRTNPVTFDGNPCGQQPTGILLPNGEVEFYDGRAASVDEFVSRVRPDAPSPSESNAG